MIVDEASFPDIDGESQEGIVSKRIDGLERIGIDGNDVVDFRTGHGSDLLVHPFQDGSRIGCTGGESVLRLVEGLMEDERAGSFLGREVGVAGGESESVGFADEGSADDGYGDIEIAHHPAQDRKLLRVLLPEDSDVGPCDMDQFEADGQYAGEMDWAEGSAHYLGEGGFDEGDGRIVAVHFGGRRCENGINAFLFEQFEIMLFVARVLGKIFIRSELGWIDEDGYDDAGSIFAGDSHQGGVSLVEISHCRDERDGFAGMVPRIDKGGKF